MAEEGDASEKKDEWISEQFCSVIIVKLTKKANIGKQENASNSR